MGIRPRVPMATFYHSLTRSDHPAAKAARRLYWGVMTFTLPAPKLVFKPLLFTYIVLRGAFYFLKRVFVCEPFFKAYCKRYGRGVRTGVFIHWVQGDGNIVLGNKILVDGKCNFIFASRYSQAPTLEVGDGTFIGHECGFTVGRKISIGKHCLISSQVWMFDTSGHPTDPALRLANAPTPEDKVRPIVIEDNVWVGSRSIIFPGVTIGEGSVVSAASLVRDDVPPYTLVAGNPARVVASLQRPVAEVPADTVESAT